MIPARRLGVSEVASILGIAEKTLRTRLQSRMNGNRWKLRKSSLRDCPPMKKCGSLWKIYGPELESWMSNR